MTRFLVSALGSAGDVHPFISISQALLARGHGVRMVAAPYFEERIRRAGVPFAPMGLPGEYERILKRPELWQPRGGARFIIDELLQRLPDAVAVTDALTGPDTVLVGSTLAWGSRLVQDLRGLRGATVHLSPIGLQSATAPAILPGIGDLSWMPAWSLRMLQAGAERFVLDRWIGPRLNLVRAALGLPAVMRIWSRWMNSPDLVVGAWPDWFAPRQEDWPPNSRTSGFPLFDEGGVGLDPALLAFLDVGPAPIGFTPGSAMAHGRRFFADAIDACEATRRRAVLVTPFREQLPANLPPWAHHAAWAPFSALLPRLAALVHHGGIGTSAQALAAGIPQIVVPFAHDQFDNAARLRRLGVSTTLDASAPASQWVAAVRELTDSPAVAPDVRRNAARMASERPAGDVVADLLEELGACQRPVTQQG